MKKSLLIIAISIITSFAYAQAPVIGGKYVVHGDYPWIVSLEAQGFPLCGAVLIAPDWVLTAGHCGSGLPPFIPQADKVYINLYSRSSINTDAETILVDSIFVHEDYDVWNGEGPDIALIRLKQRSSITPISIVGTNDQSLYSTNSKCKVVGWGSVNSFGQQSDTLREADVFITNFDTCKANYANSGINWILKDFQVCAGYLKDSTEAGAGAGDSGGPLFAWQNGQWVHIGIVSGGNSNITTEDYPGVFTRTIEMRDWIDSVMAANSFFTATSDPASIQLSIKVINNQLEINSDPDNRSMDIKLYNLIGQQVTTFSSTGSMAKIDIGDLVTGVYVVNIRTEKGMVSRKFYKH